MKPFEYYEPGCLPGPSLAQLRKEAAAVLDQTPLTKSQRKEAESEMLARTRDVWLAAHNAYGKIEIENRNEFWRDCRASLTYGRLPEDICSKIESYAWELGHSGGYSEVYNALTDVEELIAAVCAHYNDKPKKT